MEANEKARELVERRTVLVHRLGKLYIIRNDIYPVFFNRVNRLIIAIERKLKIIDKILGW